VARNEDGFTIDLETEGFRDWTETVIKELRAEHARLFLRKTALEFLKRVIDRTPVDKGRARAGWQSFLIDQGAASPITGPDVDPAAVAEGRSLSSYQEGGGLFSTDHFIEIINGVSYMIYLEYGSSDQAPAGMVRVTFREIQLGQVMSKAMSERLQKLYTQVNRRMRSQRLSSRGRGFGALSAVGSAG